MLIHNKLDNWKVVLVSQSPRRRELLKGLEIEFESTSVDTDETYPTTLQGADIPLYISKQKAEAYREFMAENTLAITADTVVFANGKILGKPKSKEDAVNMLKTLSGRTHQVITGVCLCTKERCHSFHSISEVTFDTLSDEEILHYIEVYKPFDKAGSYGIQEWIGYIGITNINGSYYNIMGLPVQKLYREINTNF